MLDSKRQSPPAALTEALHKAGLATARTEYTRLTGGRTNRLWRFAQAQNDYVCKLFTRHAATPLFPNDPQAEASALRALQGTGLAPELCDYVICAEGDALVYRYVEKTAKDADLNSIANAMSRLHMIAPPRGLRTLSTPVTLFAQADTMLRDLDHGQAKSLITLRPPTPATNSTTAFLHGDVVPANIIATPTGPCLIDWQCPAIGDPALDLAIFLSPAMQHLYGGTPLGEREIATFLTAYSDAETTSRYYALRPVLHWRMAAYCLWKVAAGDGDYAAGYDLELAQLKKLG
jgi:thiamine kinase